MSRNLLIPGGTGPNPGPVAAPWFQPCRGNLFIGRSSTSGLQYSGMKLTVFGGTFRDWRFTSFTICSSAPYVTGGILSLDTAGTYWQGAEVDVWGAKDAGLWSSSLAISVDVTSNTPAASFDCGAGISLGGVRIVPPYVYGSTVVAPAVAGVKRLTSVAASCVSALPRNFVVTVYDDGTIAVA